MTRPSQRGYYLSQDMSLKVFVPAAAESSNFTSILTAAMRQATRPPQHAFRSTNWIDDLKEINLPIIIEHLGELKQLISQEMKTLQGFNDLGNTAQRFKFQLICDLCDETQNPIAVPSLRLSKAKELLKALKQLSHFNNSDISIPLGCLPSQFQLGLKRWTEGLQNDIRMNCERQLGNDFARVA